MTTTVHRRPNAHAPASLDEDQAAAHGRLTARLAEVLDAGELVPCLDAPVAGTAEETTAADWIAENRAGQARAAAACRTCPALDECALYAVAYPEPAGVWGAMTPTDRAEARAGQARLDELVDLDA